MAITKEVVVSKLDIDHQFKTVSIRLDTIIKEDDVIISSSCHRNTFHPGQIEEVKTYLGVDTSEELVYLEAIWTAEVIADYEAMIAAQED